MKKIFVIFVISLVSISLWGQGIKFEKNLTIEKSIQKAKSENKLVFIDAYTVWCSPCKWMDQNVFNSVEVGQFFNNNFVALKINTETKEGGRIKNLYDVEGLPGFAFINGKGEVVMRDLGRMSAKEFLELCQSAIDADSDPNSAAAMSLQYENKKNNEKFLMSYLDKLKNSKFRKIYVDEFNQLVKITTIPDSSTDMIDLLFKHNEQITLGSEAEKIINKNIKSSVWREYIKKDIREMFQNINRQLVMTTSDYAAYKKDIKILEYTINRAGDLGFKTDQASLDKIYLEFYKKTDNADEVKGVLSKNLNAICSSTDIKLLRGQHENTIKSRAASGMKNMVITNCMKVAEGIAFSIKDFYKYASTEQDYQDMLRWSNVAYQLYYDKVVIANSYANILYEFGDKKEALIIKEKVVLQKDASSYMKDELNKMRKGEML